MIYSAELSIQGTIHAHGGSLNLYEIVSQPSKVIMIIPKSLMYLWTGNKNLGKMKCFLLDAFRRDSVVWECE